MSDLVHPVLRESRRVELRGLRERIPLLSPLRRALASDGPAWLPLASVLAANIYNAAADFCGDDFNDDVTILVVKCNLGRSSTPGSYSFP